MAELSSLGKRSKSADESCSSWSTPVSVKKRNYGLPFTDKLEIPPSVSSWTRHVANKLGIVYHKKPTDVAEFFKISEGSREFIYPFKGENKQILDSLVSVTQKKLCKARKLNGTVFSEEAAQCISYLHAAASFQEIMADLDKLEKEASNQSSESRYLRRSHIKLEEFFMQLNKFYIKRGDELSKKEVTCKRTMKIGDISATSVPDLCFWAPFPLAYFTCYSIGVVTVTEVKVEQKEQGDDESFDISTAVCDQVLGQHAGELLLEIRDSAFENVALGIICMQTKIIFTHLEIGQEHLAMIQRNGDVDGRFEVDGRESGTIYYTKPYDYMNESDRSEILEFLFWLGLHSLPVVKRLKPNN
ncbi:uncharacterized protein LOC125661348 isoform X2 [Ostrea edulis]|uniref:uncharacterized protein LOC125661348 isoform X2 n=1 Tax=Ostrea edulis TaxID=37623 RepID=UPI0024AEC9DE|nr:uncharacterized protein LOC125661348 isoform X2 [Ostrea edulis]